ncbi:hypothetical protein ACT3CE_04915 [Marinifilum sp. RC60d5]|uniref:hypothetical protein n=1 Tax=Marinifilum sp. RC60d5 TaxID=3458414 RepID=UPI004035E36A
MKNIVLTLMSAIILIGGTLSTTAQEKEIFREESMRKFTVSNTTVQLEKGTMWVYNYGDVKLHTYETKDFFGTFAFILEKNGKAVLLETPPVKDNYEELINYINGLGHKSIDLIVSYHPIGADFIKTDKLKFTNIYSMQHATDHYATGAGAPSLIGLKKRFGDPMDVTIYKPTVLMEEGVNEIAGIKFDISNKDFAFDLAIPEINAIHLHMLGHDKHALIFSFEFLDQYIAQLEGYQKKGYDMIFSSHGEPETQGDVTIKLHYLQDLKSIAKASTNKEEFLAKMNKAYPNFGWPFYLQGTANFLFKN